MFFFPLTYFSGDVWQLWIDSYIKIILSSSRVNKFLLSSSIYLDVFFAIKNERNWWRTVNSVCCWMWRDLSYFLLSAPVFPQLRAIVLIFGWSNITQWRMFKIKSSRSTFPCLKRTLSLGGGWPCVSRWLGYGSWWDTSAVSVGGIMLKMSIQTRRWSKESLSPLMWGMSSSP